MTWEDIPGFFDFQDIYTQAVEEAQEGDILVEVGSYLGKSTVFLARQLIDSGKYCSFFAVDTFNKPGWVRVTEAFGASPLPVPPEMAKFSLLYDAFRYNLARCGVDGVVQILPQLSTIAARSFPDNSCSFVFLDADHEYSSVKEDLEAWVPKVKPGGIIAGHDYEDPLWPGVAKAVNEKCSKVEKRGNSWMVRKEKP
jgi:predicted O-methyltransferase YrrM